MYSISHTFKLCLVNGIEWLTIGAKRQTPSLGFGFGLFNNPNTISNNVLKRGNLQMEPVCRYHGIARFFTTKNIPDKPVSTGQLDNVNEELADVKNKLKKVQSDADSIRDEIKQVQGKIKVLTDEWEKEGAKFSKKDQLDFFERQQATLEREQATLTTREATLISERDKLEGKLPSKARLLTQETAQERVERLAVKLTQLQVETMPDEQGTGELKFLRNDGSFSWLGEKSEQLYSLYIRDCYLKLSEKILSTSRTMGKFVITGTPGTAKSHCALYCIHELYRRGEAVYYDFKHVETVDPRFLFVGTKALQAAGIRELGIEREGVYVIDEELHGKVLKIPQVIRFWDPPTGEIRSVHLVNKMTVIVSSPKVELNDFKKIACERWIMPLWTLQELRNAAYIMRCHNQKVKDTTGAMIEMTNALIDERFYKFGGNARGVFNFEYDLELEGALESKTTAKKIDELFAEGLEDLPATNITSLLVHRDPLKVPGKVKVVVASKYVEERLLSRLKGAQKEKLMRFIAMSHDVEGATEYTGTMFEKAVHGRFCKGPECEVAYVGTYANPLSNPQFVKVKFPPSTLLNVKRTFAEIVLGVNTYTRPAKKNYPALDAIYKFNSDVLNGVMGVVPGASWPQKQVVVTAALQCMVGEHKPLPGIHMRHAFVEAGALLPERKPGKPEKSGDESTKADESQSKDTKSEPPWKNCVVFMVTNNPDRTTPIKITTSTGDEFKIDDPSRHVPQYVVRTSWLENMFVKSENKV